MTNVTDNATNVILLDDNTREKLEADVRGKVVCSPMVDKDEGALVASVREVIGWLDRQAAITERECIDRWDAKATLEIAELRAKVDELTDERDELLEQVERYAEEAANFEQQLADMESAYMDKNAVQRYNSDVQVVAEQKNEYTIELRHRHGATTSISVAFRLE